MNKELKQQLAEKDKEIERLLKNFEYYLIDLLAGNYDNILGIIIAYIERVKEELKGE